MTKPASPPSTWRIGDLAREFGITTRAIRHYEAEGLLRPERSGTTRIYHAADRTRLKLILRGNRLGFTLAESREVIGMYDPHTGNRAQLEKLLAILDAKRAHLERQRDDIRQMQQELDEVERRCRDVLCRTPPDTARQKPSRRRPGS